MNPIYDDRRYLIPFRAILLPQIFTDVLVLGAGVAGLRAALTAADGSDVICLSKAGLDRSNTWQAQGGIAAALGDWDSVDAHVEDTLGAGAGLCDRAVVERTVSDGIGLVRELIEHDMPFDRDEQGDLLFGREGAHRNDRILHASGDATGRVLAETLIARARRHERIRLFEDCFALDLITDGGNSGRCLGAITHHPRFGLQVIWARTTVLASGGAGQVYRETTNAAVATGDGIAMAYRAGAELADLEFVQFHPTTLYVAGAARTLISEAVRGEGAVLVDRQGRRFMSDVHELADLAPRDVVSRTIHRVLGAAQDSSVYLDARSIGSDRFRRRFPGIWEVLDRFDIDPGRDLIPIRPSAHYMIGGVVTDERSRSSLPGLLACGEAASTGLHGANRLASNSLLEGLTTGHAAGLECLSRLDQPVGEPMKIVADIRPSDRSELDVADVLSSLRSVLWRHVGIERSGDRMEEVAEMFDFWSRYTLDKIFDERRGWEVQNALVTGALIVRAARWRRESRGTHFRVDLPGPDERFRVRAGWARYRDEPREIPVSSA
jgi:L-aspartate oxidase